MKKANFKIKITQAVGWMWYSDKINKIFKVKNFQPECFILEEGNRIVWKTDCIIIN